MPVANGPTYATRQLGQTLYTLLDLCMSSLRRGHADLLCIVPILTDDLRKESSINMRRADARPVAACRSLRRHCVCSRSGRPLAPSPLQRPLARVATRPPACCRHCLAFTQGAAPLPASAQAARPASPSPQRARRRRSPARAWRILHRVGAPHAIRQPARLDHFALPGAINVQAPLFVNM